MSSRLNKRRCVRRQLDGGKSRVGKSEVDKGRFVRGSKAGYENKG